VGGFGVLEDGPQIHARNLEDLEIPDTFDAREQWPLCTSIGTIRNQEGCGSCYAFGATESLADRFCISQKVNVTLSPQFIVDCDKTDAGCGGGYLDNAWRFMMKNGVLTEECLPYSGEGHVCQFPGGSCQDGTTPTYYHAATGYRVGPNVSVIQAEIMQNGPVESSFFVYADFMTYSGGVYQKTPGAQFLGLHAVRTLGWGVDNGTPYWLVANSWGPTWGLSGFFKILRGNDEVGIENQIAVGVAGSITTSTSLTSIPVSNNVPSSYQEKPKPTEGPELERPSFPSQLFVNFTIPSLLGPTVNGTWYFDYVNQYQRMDYFVFEHDFATIYDYKKGEAYYFYGMFNEFVCYTQEIPSAVLSPGVPDNATYEGCINTIGINESMWLQYWPDYTLEYYVQVDSPHLLLALGVGFGMFQSETMIFEEYQLKQPDPAKFQVPKGTVCPPWPGTDPVPPPGPAHHQRLARFFQGLVSNN